MSFTGRRYTQPAPVDHGESLNPYLLNDVHAGKSWQIRNFRTGIRFSVYNIFNVSYQAVRSRPMPMRNYEISLNLGI
jgi:hypothetical protein